EGEGELGGGGAEEPVALGSLLFEEEQGGGVGDGVGAGGDGDVVAAELTLLAEAGADPPDGGMEEEEGFDHGLEDVPEVVGAADVGELVGEDGFELLGGEDGEGGGREQDERTDHPYGQRADDARRQTEGDASADADAAGEAHEAGGELWRDLLGGGAAQALDEPPS